MHIPQGENDLFEFYDREAWQVYVDARFEQRFGLFAEKEESEEPTE